MGTSRIENRKNICFNTCPYLIKKRGNFICPSFGRKVLSNIYDMNSVCTKGLWPMPIQFYNRDKTVDLTDLYRDQKVFLLCNGPSRNKEDLSILKTPGIMTMTMNNGGHDFRSNFWCACDTPAKFMRSIWYDQTILKFIPKSQKNCKVVGNAIASEFPATLMFNKKTLPDTNDWLNQDAIVWNTSKECPNVRTTILACIHILYILGFRTIYLLGADFHMEQSNPYCFEESRNIHSVEHNNHLFRCVDTWFDKMKIQFNQANLKIINCTKGSHIKNLPYMDYAEAVKSFPYLELNESTRGKY